MRTLALLLVLPACSWAAETAVVGGMSGGYSYDDNIQMSAVDKISLAGLKVDGYLEYQYNTSQLKTATRLKLAAEHYDHADLDSNNVLLDEPDTSDFDNESYYLTTNLSYELERHTLSLFGEVSQDSNINTQFAEGGLGGIRQLEGATDVDKIIIRPSWLWQLNERQTIQTSLLTQFVDYESDRYINYDYYSVQSTWFYVLNERMQLQLRPLASRYENAAASSITSDTLGIEAGVVWSITEKWELNALGGATQVSTDYDDSGFFFFNPDTGMIEFFELEDDDNNGFTGSGELKYTEELYSVSAHVESRYSPSANGYLQEDNEARLTFHWKPRERLRIDIDGRVGRTDTSGNQVNNQRTYGEVAFRAGYQFAKEWWVSARYRYREQDRDRSSFGSANGNLVSATVSYRLPKEIL